VDPQLKSDELTCDQAMSQMTLAPASELTGSAALAQHVASCADCARVALVILERERAAGLQQVSRFDAPDSGLIFGLNTAEHSRGLIFGFSRRRVLGRFILTLVTVAAIVLVWSYVADNIDRYVGDSTPKTEVLTVKLNCLTPEAAVALADPYLREKGSGTTIPAGVSAIVLHGPASALSRASATIAQFDGANGRCPAPTPAPPHP
jgi:hypothetical protein